MSTPIEVIKALDAETLKEILAVGGFAAGAEKTAAEYALRELAYKECSVSLCKFIDGCDTKVNFNNFADGKAFKQLEESLKHHNIENFQSTMIKAKMELDNEIANYQKY